MYACKEGPKVSHTIRPRRICARLGRQAYLGTVGEKSRLLVIEIDGLRVELDRGQKVATGKGLIALVLEVDSLRHRGVRATASRDWMPSSEIGGQGTCGYAL